MNKDAIRVIFIVLIVSIVVPLIVVIYGNDEVSREDYQTLLAEAQTDPNFIPIIKRAIDRQALTESHDRKISKRGLSLIYDEHAQLIKYKDNGDPKERLIALVNEQFNFNQQPTQEKPNGLPN